MSEPMVTTGAARAATCIECGAEVTEQQLRGLYGSVVWNLARHDAPCGLPCFGAGVPGKSFRLSEFHRNQQRCPRCCPGSSVR